MALKHFVPAGKVLKIRIGGYRFVGPVQVKLSGNQPLPKTYTDGTLTTPAIEVKPVFPEPEPIQDDDLGPFSFSGGEEETPIDCTEDDES